MKFLLLTTLLICSFTLHAQLKNEKEVLAKNRVKSELENTCTGSCSAKYSTFDKRGNLIEWNFFRIGFLLRKVYDKADREVMSLYIDKMDTTDIDTSFANVEPELDDYVETYDADLRQLTKTRGEERLVISYDERKNPIEETRLGKGEVVSTKVVKYDKLQRIIESKVTNQSKL